MRIKRDDNWLRWFTVLFLGATAWAYTISAHAAGPTESGAGAPERLRTLEYEVRPGDSLGAIAHEHDVSLAELMNANDLRDPDRIFAGQKLIVPQSNELGTLTRRGAVIRVPEGFFLSRIAAIYGVSVAAIVRANRMTDPDRLRVGQRLLIPGATELVELTPPPPCFNEAVELYRVRTDDSRTVPLTFCNGRANPDAVQALSELSAPPRMEMPFPLHSRLAVMLQQVANRWPGHRIEVISGQRLRKTPGRESYHNKGQALDFRVEGVSNKQLAWFLRKIDDTGVGYYPNSVFVHLDTREESAWWIDYSRPGEKAIYGRANMSAQEIERIRTARRSEAEHDAADQAREEAERESRRIAEAIEQVAAETTVENETEEAEENEPSES